MCDLIRIVILHVLLYLTQSHYLLRTHFVGILECGYAKGWANF